jgi:alpha-D-xyloside xylohydrolase
MRKYLYLVLFCVATLPGPSLASQEERFAGEEFKEVASGIWQVRFGNPEPFVPTAFRQRNVQIDQIRALEPPGPPPFPLQEVRFRRSSGRLVVYIPCDEVGHEIYGFGLDPGAFEQKGLRKFLTVSAQTWKKTGAGHGPVPFYVSTAGYGVYVDTARVPFVHVARLARKTVEGPAEDVAEVVFDIPAATGIDVFVFGGPSLREAVQRYILFSGGGCVPPLWGLGMKYRTYAKGDVHTVMEVAEAIRRNRIPCDMFGLEPGWQTHAYSSSLVWSRERFPDPDRLVQDLLEMNFQVNLWEHAYLHPESPLFEPLRKRSGDYLVWDGLVVDFVDPDADRLFADFHDDQFIKRGIAGFKLDECDRQIITDTEPFNFPYASYFPSGIDGDQMSQLYGYLYQRSIYSVFLRHNKRTWGDVRATGALAAPLPFSLYSDAYGFDQYLRQLVNASFAGLLWSPEVRRAGTFEELANRVAMSAFAPQMCLNIWFAPNALWLQYDGEKNKANVLLPPEEQESVAAMIRQISELRMRLLPYFYSAFYRYRFEGLPPTRALIIEFPEDPGVRGVDSEFMFGDQVLVAPFTGSEHSREVYFPAGTNWVDFDSRKVYEGGTSTNLTGKPGDIPFFVKMNTLLPLAEPLQYVGEKRMFNLTVRVYGDDPAPFVLFEDDGLSFDFEQGMLNRVLLEWADSEGKVTREGPYSGRRYWIKKWDKVEIRTAL